MERLIRPPSVLSLCRAEPRRPPTVRRNQHPLSRQSRPPTVRRPSIVRRHQHPLSLSLGFVPVASSAAASFSARPLITPPVTGAPPRLRCRPACRHLRSERRRSANIGVRVHVTVYLQRQIGLCAGHVSMVSGAVPWTAAGHRETCLRGFGVW